MHSTHTSESETEINHVSAAISLWQLYREVSEGRMTLDTIDQLEAHHTLDSMNITVTHKENSVTNGEQDEQWITVLDSFKGSEKKK